MKQQGKKILKWVLKTLAFGFVGAVLMLLAVGIYILNQKPDLKIWHTAQLDAEFSESSPVENFADYLALEERLFAQLDGMVYDRIDKGDKGSINRYHRGSLSDPQRWPTNWNRSYELKVDPAGDLKAGILLLHGLSDSPYSLRTIGERLHAEGAHVLGLRVPGHGTIPSALTETRWEDMAAAVVLAMRHLKQAVGDRPIYMVGYSNGGALAVRYTLSSIETPELPKVAGMILISPEIGISAMAGLAIWQDRIGGLLGLKKLEWNSVIPEYDPFKYGSFPVNAGDLAHQLTRTNRAELLRMSNAGKLEAFPPVLAFQSAVDSTVSAVAIVNDLFMRLPQNRHELVVFDLNRYSKVEPLLKSDPKAQASSILSDPYRTFVFSVIGNGDTDGERVVLRCWEPGQSSPTKSELGLSWPRGIYSLSHVALPFPGNDPLYGGDQPLESPGIQFGRPSLQGEKGVIHIPAADLLRMRWNPFYSYLEQRIVDRLELGEQETEN